MFNKKKVMRNSQKQKTMTHTWGVRGGDGESSLQRPPQVGFGGERIQSSYYKYDQRIKEKQNNDLTGELKKEQTLKRTK